MNAISLMSKATSDRITGPTLVFATGVAAAFAGMAITNTSTLATAPTNPELIMWTLAGANAGFLTSLVILHNALTAKNTLTQGREHLITLSGAALLLTGGAIGHLAARLSAN